MLKKTLEKVWKRLKSSDKSPSRERAIEKRDEGWGRYIYIY